MLKATCVLIHSNGSPGGIDVRLIKPGKMRHLSRTTRWLVLMLVVGLVVATGCIRSPQAKKAHHLERGDRLFSLQRYSEAIREYRNVLRLDGAHAHAFQQIGLAYYQLGELEQAFPFLLRAKVYHPNNLDIRLKLGTIYLLAHKLEETWEEAHFILDRGPKNFEALLLLAVAANTPEKVDVAIKQLEKTQADFRDRANLPLALGGLYLQRQDLTSAERAFKAAVVREPTSIEGHMVLGHFYLGQGDLPLAERALEMAAEIAPTTSEAQINLADFYILLRKTDRAKEILEKIVREEGGYLPSPPSPGTAPDGRGEP
jgi:tetratricopeptide (TPR) repeat protein